MDARSLRLFVALEVPSAWRDGVAREIARVARWDPRARTVPAGNVHVTVAFLGATPADRAPAGAEALRAAAQGVAATRAALEGLGAFPSVERPRVVWAGLREEPGTSPLARLADAVRERLARAGFPIDERDRFHAHLTLARLDRPPSPELRKGLTSGRLQGTYSAEMLSDLVLMVSEATPGGSRYRAIERVVLPSSGDGGSDSSPPKGTPMPNAGPPDAGLPNAGPPTFRTVT